MHHNPEQQQQKKIRKEYEIFFSIYIICYSVSIIILRHNRIVCVKSGKKLMMFLLVLVRARIFRAGGKGNTDILLLKLSKITVGLGANKKKLPTGQRI